MGAWKFVGFVSAYNHEEAMKKAKEKYPHAIVKEVRQHVLAMGRRKGPFQFNAYGRQRDETTLGKKIGSKVSIYCFKCGHYHDSHDDCPHEKFD